MSTNTTPAALPVHTLEDLCGVADESSMLLGEALQSDLLPEDNVYSTTEGGSVAALITAARDLHLAAQVIAASGKGLASAEARQDIQDALGAATLVAGYMDQMRRKLAS